MIARFVRFACQLGLTVGVASSAQAVIIPHYSIGPDAAGYVANDFGPYTFTDISTTGTRILNGEDDETASASIGFNFQFYGDDYSTAFVSTNGMISFGGANDDPFNPDLAAGGVDGAPLIAVFWDDLQFDRPGTDAVYYQTLGAPGSRSFVVQWNQAGGFPFDDEDDAVGSPSTATFEAILFEGSNGIAVSYADIDFGDSRTDGGSATVGIQGPHGEYLQWLAQDVEEPTDPPITSGQTIQFSPSAVPEPGTLTLACLGACGLFAGAKFRRRTACLGRT